jgi:CRP/FNR family transcriptional regulator, cyclic AMP receptor protein
MARPCPVPRIISFQFRLLIDNAMFDHLLRPFRTATARKRELSDSPAALKAAELLRGPSAMQQLSPTESRVVVSYMVPRAIPAGTVFIEEGDSAHTGFMVLVLEGEVTVENIIVSRVSPITVSVLGEGAMLGEMGLLDGAPRSASCTASADSLCAVLTREALEELMEDNPRIGAKFMTAIGIRVGERLRENTDKLKLYVRLTKTMQEEIDRLMPHH